MNLKTIIMISLRDVTDVGYDMFIAMLRFRRHYNDTIRERLATLISFCSKFIGVGLHVCQKLSK